MSHIPVAPQTPYANALAANLLSQVKTPTVLYPIGNGAHYAIARMDMREIAWVINNLALSAGVRILAALPTGTSRQIGTRYVLTHPSYTGGVMAPPGEYYFNGQGWICKTCFDAYVDTISGNVIRTYVPGAIYRVTVAGPVTTLNIHLTAVGSTQILLINLSEHSVHSALRTFIDNEPGVYERSAEGVVAADATRVEIQIAHTGYEEIWSCINLYKDGDEALPT